MSDLVLESRDGTIVTLTLNAPEIRNPISDPEMIAALIAAIEKHDADVNTRVIILTGAGKAFSSGGNIKKMGKAGGLNDPVPANTRRNYRHGIQRIPRLFQRIEVPVIAAVNGPAIGAGCDLTCMCDIRIAGESAVFAESFVKLGIIPGDGGAWLLQRIIGISKAMEMSLTGDSITAQEALAIGLVSKVVPDSELMDAARAIAKRIADNPPHAVRMTRRLMWEAQDQTLDAVLELSSAMQALSHATGDHDEAVAAMLEKRKPSFKGS